MKNYPKISIITPSFNQGQYIEQTILSVINQNYPNLEYIIIDGGSTDNTTEIIKKYESQITYWVSENDRGHSHAVNKGLKHCTGEIFNWLNSDDYYEPKALFKIAEEFMKNSELHIVGGRERAFNSETNKTVEIYKGTNTSDELEELIYQGIIDQPPTFWKMKIINTLGNLPENLHYTMDSYWWTKYLLNFGKKKVKKIPDIITNFRLHSGSKTVSEQDKFNSNRFAIRYAVAKELNFSKSIINFLKTQTDIKPEISFGKINLTTESSTQSLEANFAKHIYQRYYMLGDYQNSKICFKLAFRKYKTVKTYIDFMKLVVLPEKIISFFRKLKSSA